jgi:hypothetical protein
MRPLNRGLLWTASCVLALGCSATVLAQNAQSTDNSRLQSAQPSTSSAEPINTRDSSAVDTTVTLPDSPGVTLAKLQEAAPQQGDSAQSTAPSPAQSSNQQNSAQSQQEHKLQRPVGTAAAAAPGVSGVTAAQPAGVAIAPAKQHRVRTIILRTGAILGAGAAIGTVIALTRATPSKPPGAH